MKPGRSQRKAKRLFSSNQALVRSTGRRCFPRPDPWSGRLPSPVKSGNDGLGRRAEGPVFRLVDVGGRTLFPVYARDGAGGPGSAGARRGLGGGATHSCPAAPGSLDHAPASAYLIRMARTRKETVA